MTVKSKKMVKKIDSERKVKVYRIEHPEDKHGPFGWGDYDAGHAMNNHLPTPCSDEKLYELKIKKSHVFGCRYKSLLKEWVDNKKELDKMGFVVRTYEIEKKHVHHGDYQSVFLKNKASCIEEKSVVEFFSRKKGNLTREQHLMWRNDFENISFNSHFVEKWIGQEEIYPCSAPVIAVVRGKYQTGVFILNKGETLFLLDNSMKLDVRLVHEWAFLE